MSDKKDEFLSIEDHRSFENIPLEIVCEYCGQEFWLNDFRIATLLYGIILLEKEKDCYCGITCPQCLHTIMSQFSRKVVNIIIDSFDWAIDIGNISYFLHLGYYATPLYFNKNDDLLKNYGIYFSSESEFTWSHIRSLDIFDEVIPLEVKNNPELEALYCSYNGVVGLPYGFSSTICWFEERYLKDLVNLENEKPLTIFPRYFCKSVLHEDIENFCWNYRIYNESPILRNDSKSEKNHIYFDLLKILTAKSLGIDISTENENQSDWKDHTIFAVVNPFKERDTDTVLDEIASKKWIGFEQLSNYTGLIQEIEKYINRDYVQEFVIDNHIRYIDEYAKLIQLKNLSLASILNFNKRYLYELYKTIKRESLGEAQYAFYPEGPSWAITFNRKTIRGLKGKGFLYLYFLICNKNKSFSAEDINDLNGVDPDHVNDEPGIKKSSNTSNSPTDLSKISKPKFQHNDMITGESIGEIKREMKRLRQELKEAEVDDDPLILKMAQEKFDEFIKHYTDYFSRDGHIKKICK